MGAAGSRELTGGLTKAEVERLKRRFERQAGKSGKLSLADLQRIPELSGNFFVARIFRQADTDRDGVISVSDFTDAVEMLGRLQTEEDRTRFAFGLFDVDEDGFVSQSDLLSVIQHSSRTGTDREQLEKTIASLLLEYDADGDGRLSLKEFARLASPDAICTH